MIIQETNLVTEELKPVQGKNSGGAGMIVDADTNEPIANYQKRSYGNKYDLKWHPTFLAIHPEVKHSLIAQDIHKAEPTSKDMIAGNVERIHGHLAKNGFADKFRATPVEGGDGDHLYSDSASGEHILTHGQERDYPYKNRTKLHPDFVGKHNLSDSVVKSFESKINAETSHIGREYAISNMVGEVAKKKVATGLHATAAASAVYHTDEAPEVASAAHEEFLKGTHSIKRLSPTHFIGTNKNGTVHSIVDGNTIHQISVSDADSKVPFHKSF